MAPKTVPMKDLAINALNKLKTDKDLGKNGYSGIGRITKAAKTEKADVQAKKLSKAIKSLVESGDVVHDGKRFKLKSARSASESTRTRAPDTPPTHARPPGTSLQRNLGPPLSHSPPPCAPHTAVSQRALRRHEVISETHEAIRRGCSSLCNSP